MDLRDTSFYVIAVVLAGALSWAIVALGASPAAA